MTPANDWEAALFAAAQAGDLAKASDALAAGANVNAANPHKRSLPKPAQEMARHSWW